MLFGALSFIVLAAAVIVALPVAIFLLESVAAIALPERTSAPSPSGKARGRIGVLIPAHNEEEMLSETIATMRPQLRNADWLLVVADNCSDNTASVAKALGADVIIRTDPNRMGKGFALDYGIRHFARDPPGIVVVVDADCKLGDSAIDYLGSLCNATNRPVQARYVMKDAASPTEASQFREFAWRVKNWMRPLGLSSAGLPCQLMGTGMAFPWEIIARANLATGALVEDLKLGLELAADGHSPMFCPAAVVVSEFPATGEGTRSQQLRWEQGHLGVIATEVPRYFLKALRQGNMDLLVLTLDAAVPPLSLLLIIVLGFIGVSLGAWLIGMGSKALLIGLACLAGFTCAIMFCWLKTGRDLLPPKSIVIIIISVLKKIPFYYRIMLRRTDSTWIRTDRRRL